MAAVDELLTMLDEAAKVVSGYSAMCMYCGYDTGEEFAAELRNLRERVARQDWSALRRLFAIFAPTGAWDDGVDCPGSMELADRIMAVLNEMDWSRLSAQAEGL
jgi:hypothetical protein